MTIAQEQPHLKLREPPRTGSSLNDLIIQNPSLSVHPLYWTAQHAQLLGCEFHDIDIPLQAEAKTENTAPGTDAMGYAAKKLATHFATAKRHQAARDILRRKGSPLEHVRGSPTFFLARSNVHIPECRIFRPATTANAPTANDSASTLIVGYYHYDQVTKEREDRFQAALDSFARPSISVYRTLQKKHAEYTPDVWTRDPYLVCVMLSLAQHRRDDLDPSQSMNYQVRLLVSKKGDTTHAHVFDGEFSTSVLKQLDNPSRRKKATWPTIFHTKVPYQPYDTFANRITSHLMRNKHSLSIREAGTGSQCIPKKRKFGHELQV
ncbi:hypothetical protein HYE68_003958 [Fusarium pseudograminearum]|nr:hypothetical protein HYE68_003958 [Fusarium pseudograminearum]